MRIAVCDDQISVVENLQTLIRQFDEEYNIKSEVYSYTKPSELFNFMQKDNVDVIFMDLEFEDENEDGIVWLKKIRQYYPQTIIIILTAYENRYKEGYEVRAFRFMTKPVIEKELFEYLYLCMEELQLTKYIPLVRRGIPHNIPLRDICYFAAQSGGSELWTRTDMYACEESLLHWEKILPNDIFFRCHSKYLVNLGFVTSFENQILTLVNGEKIPVSRRKWKAFQIAYMRFDTKNFGGGYRTDTK